MNNYYDSPLETFIEEIEDKTKEINKLKTEKEELLQFVNDIYTNNIKNEYSWPVDEAEILLKKYGKIKVKEVIKETVYRSAIITLLTGCVIPIDGDRTRREWDSFILKRFKLQDILSVKFIERFTK